MNPEETHHPTEYQPKYFGQYELGALLQACESRKEHLLSHLLRYVPGPRPDPGIKANDPHRHESLQARGPRAPGPSVPLTGRPSPYLPRSPMGLSPGPSGLPPSR